jgi:ubiquitin thioesterase OTU1
VYAFIIDKPETNQSSSFMRELVASTVMNQPDQYNEALLGKPNKEYKKWILQVKVLI